MIGGFCTAVKLRRGNSLKDGDFGRFYLVLVGSRSRYEVVARNGDSRLLTRQGELMNNLHDDISEMLF